MFKDLLVYVEVFGQTFTTYRGRVQSFRLKKKREFLCHPRAISYQVPVLAYITARLLVEPRSPFYFQGAGFALEGEILDSNLFKKSFGSQLDPLKMFRRIIEFFQINVIRIVLQDC